MTSPWVTSPSYESSWTRLQRSGGGGQGDGFQVTRIGDSAGEIRFLKVLKDQTNPERRARMFREAAALDTFTHPRIPRLIESNASLHHDKTPQLYLVTEFIQGKPLGAWLGKRWSFDDSIAITLGVADAVEHSHATGGVHRDIKPDNVMLRGNKADPVLIDFGLTFNRFDVDDSLTGDYQELGNRFLRLPELSSYSATRHDIRTDVAFIAGILYFCLFGAVPAVLVNEQGQLPHQRPSVSLDAVTANPAAARMLASFFDRAFQPRISERLANVGELVRLIEGIKMSANGEAPLDNNALLVRIRSGFSAESSQRLRDQLAARNMAKGWVQSVLQKISKDLGGEFKPVSSGEYDPATDHVWQNMGLEHQYHGHHKRFWYRTNFLFIGSELVVTVSDQQGMGGIEVLRTDVVAPNLNGADLQRLESLLLTGIAGLVI